MTTLIDAKNISLSLGNNDILQDVSLTVKNDDFITVVGPNGAGKSMLLKCLIGVQKPTSGTISKKEGLKVGYAPQNISLSKSFVISVRQFLSLHKKTNNQEIEAVANRTSIRYILDDHLFNLSGGQIQRVLLARALIGSPDLLILDEPVQNIDISGQLEFYNLLNDIYQEKKVAILMVSHDLHMVMASSRKVVCLFRHICCQGKPQVVSKDPEFISLFGDDMAKMMAVYNHNHNHDHCHDHEKK